MLIMCIVHVKIKESQIILWYVCDKETNSKKLMNKEDDLHKTNKYFLYFFLNI